MTSFDLPFDDNLFDLLEEEHDGSFFFDQDDWILPNDMIRNENSAITGTYDQIEVNSIPSTETNIEETEQQKKKRRTNKQKLCLKLSSKSITKLPKKDIRRQYCIMFLNITNAFDLVLLEDFFTRYCSPNCVLNHCKSDFIPFPDSLHGIQQMIEFWKWKFTVFPDSTVEMEECKIFTTEENKPSHITAIIKGKCTKLFDKPIRMNQAKNSAKKIGKVDFYGEKRVKPRLSTLSELEETDKEIFSENVKILEIPLAITFTASFTFFIDSNKRIERFVKRNGNMEVTRLI